MQSFNLRVWQNHECHISKTTQTRYPATRCQSVFPWRWTSCSVTLELDTCRLCTVEWTFILISRLNMLLNKQVLKPVLGISKVSTNKISCFCTWFVVAEAKYGSDGKYSSFSSFSSSNCTTRMHTHKQTHCCLMSKPMCSCTIKASARYAAFSLFYLYLCSHSEKVAEHVQYAQHISPHSTFPRSR